MFHVKHLNKIKYKIIDIKIYVIIVKIYKIYEKSRKYIGRNIRKQQEKI